MKIKEVYLQNFMSFAEGTFYLSEYEGLTLIEGPNGVGKSTLLDAIVWCLFGKMLRKAKRARANDVVHRFGSGDLKTLVLVVLEVDGQEIRVERSRVRGSPNLRVTGIEKPSRTEGMQEQLERRLGFNYDLFTSSVIFGGEVSSFCSMTDAEKKNLLEKMLGFERFLKAQKIAAEEASEISKQCTDHEASIESAKEQVLTCEELLMEATESAEAFVKDHAEKGKALLDDNFEKVLAVEEAAEDLIDARFEFQERLEAYEEEVGMWEKRHAKAEKEVEHFEKKIKETDRALAIAEGQLASARQQLEEATPEKHPDTCPTCGQRWPADKQRAGLKTLIKNYEKSVKKHEDECASLKRVMHGLEVKASAARGGLQDVLRQEPEDPGDRSEVLRPFVKEFRRLVSEQQFSLRLLEEHRQRDKNPYLEQVEKLNGRLAKNKEALEVREGLLGETRVKLSLAEYWSKAFGKSGIPAYLIDFAVPQLNESAEAISRILTEGALNVFFDPAQAKGSGSSFAVDVEFRDGSDNYDMTSKGEHSRIDLTVLFSIRELLACRGQSSCSQVFIDELFDGLDDDGIAAVVRLLRQRYAEHQIFILSHNPELKGYCDSRIPVEKENRVSRIVA